MTAYPRLDKLTSGTLDELAMLLRITARTSFLVGFATGLCAVAAVSFFRWLLS